MGDEVGFVPYRWYLGHECVDFPSFCNFKSGELEWLGHSVDIHKESYRLHENTIEMAEVSKILIAIEGFVIWTCSPTSYFV